MNKHLSAIFCMVIAIGIALTGCSNLPESQDPSSSVNNAMSSQVNQAADGENSPTELVVQFGEGGTPFMMRLENNSTAEAIAGYVGTTSWQLPIYHFDESDVMQYYDIPSRYEIPDNSQTVTEAHAGDVFTPTPIASFCITMTQRSTKNIRRSGPSRQPRNLLRQWRKILYWKAGAINWYLSA